MRGRIVKAVSDFYYVYSDGVTYACKAKGIFKKNKNTPLVGDECEFEKTNTEDIEGNIISLLPRVSELKRPPVANISQALVVFALADPAPGLYLLDRFLCIMENLKLNVILCFNKTDIDNEALADDLKDLYERIGYKCILTSTFKDEGIGEIKSLLKGRITTVAGPSGVGKSSLINALAGQDVMETGIVSHKTKRGKQTTRHTELIKIDEDTFIADTPGFSNADIENVEKKDLGNLFPEFYSLTDKCRFVGCAHIKEPDCMVKEALSQGKIAESRYEHYVQIYKELEEKEGRSWN